MNSPLPKRLRTKLLPFLIAVFTTSALMASAAHAVKVSAPTDFIIPAGQTANVPISIEDAPAALGYRGVDMVLQYDNTVVQAIGGTRRLPAFPATTWFLITANISSSSVSGHAFRLGAALPHIGLDESGATPVDSQDGAAIVAADANSIVLNAQQAMKVSGGAVTIPFGGEPIMVILLVGSSLYMMRRRARTLGGGPVG